MKTLRYLLLGCAAGASVYLAAASQINRAIFKQVPTSAWYFVSEIFVADTRLGQSPRVTVVGDIRRSFEADRTVTLWQRGHGGFAMICSGVATQYFSAGARLPETTTLTEWMNAPDDKPCRIDAPGEYLVQIAWVMHFPDLPEKAVSVASNIFTVAP